MKPKLCFSSRCFLATFRALAPAFGPFLLFFFHFDTLNGFMFCFLTGSEEVMCTVTKIAVAGRRICKMVMGVLVANLSFGRYR